MCLVFSTFSSMCFPATYKCRFLKAFSTRKNRVFRKMNCVVSGNRLMKMFVYLCRKTKFAM